MFTSVEAGDIIKYDNNLFLVSISMVGHGYMCLTYLTGDKAGLTTLRYIDDVCNNIEKRYSGIDDYISIFKEKINDYSEAYYAVKRDLVDANDIINFKNGEIKRLSKELVKSVNKDAFDKAVNDMLNNKDISTVEEVSAIMKLRSAIY